MSNTNNNNMQTQTSSALHNAIMKAGSKDHPPILASVYHHQLNPIHYTQSSSTRSQAATRNRGKVIANPPQPTQDLKPEVVADDDGSSKRVVNVARARENVGTQVVQQTGIQCFNCKEFGHVARECQKPKRPWDSAYHKEKMLLCKQEEAGIQLSAQQVY
nr:hypothetical protein [Tanacetum cinerariifolium]